MRFAATHHNWEVQFAGAHPSNKSLEHFADWHPDALVIDSSCHGLAPKELAAIAGRATVFAETEVPAGWRRPCATIATDDRALAVDVPHIATALGVSVRLLQRDYRTVTGRTVMDDLQSAKLERVKNLLRTTTIPIDTIGPFCDFRSPSHLKTLFKARFGMTMSDYRKSADTSRT